MIFGWDDNYIHNRGYPVRSRHLKVDITLFIFSVPYKMNDSIMTKIILCSPSATMGTMKFPPMVDGVYSQS